jgi:hypothetical protein
LIARANQLDAVDIQTKYIASVVCAFLVAAVPLNVVKTFALSGICAVADAGTPSAQYGPTEQSDCFFRSRRHFQIFRMSRMMISMRMN